MKVFYTIFLAGVLEACNSTSNSIALTDSSYKTVVPETAFVNAQNYAGTLPCGDCEGIDVSLQLNKDSSYIMSSVYRGSRVDSDNNSFKDTGTWNMRGTDTLILLQKRSTMKYIRTDSTLTQLDGNGNRITGPLADYFILHKK